MNPQKIPRGELEKYCHTKFKEFGMTASSIHAHILAARHLADYMEKEGFREYTPEIGAMYEVYAESVKENFSAHHNRYAHRIVRRLNESFENIYRSHPERRTRQISMQGVIGDISSQYIEHRRNYDRLSERTLRKTEIVLGHLSMYCESHSVTLENISREFLLRYIDVRKKTAFSALGIVGNFFKYAYENKHISVDYSILFKGLKRPTPTKLVQYYNMDEVKQIEDSIDRSTKIGKQKYAVVLLASRLGLRSSDIAALKKENIDFEKCQIRLRQYKTNHEIILPLTEDVGVAILEYVEYARPIAGTNHIFVSVQQPHRPLTSENVGNLVRKVMQASGVKIQGRPVGPHSLRHSMATAMINQGTGLPVISDSLGHSSTQTTMTYVAVNVTSLLECSLDVPLINEDFYLQKGGYFYD